MERGKYEYYIAGGSESENQLLVVRNLGNEDLGELSEVYGKALTGDKGRERRKQRLPLLIISHAEAGSIPEVPKEVVEEIQEASGTPFFWDVWSKPRIKKIVRDLAGWNVFSVDLDLANIQQLQSELTAVSYLGLDQEVA